MAPNIFPICFVSTCMLSVASYGKYSLFCVSVMLWSITGFTPAILFDGDSFLSFPSGKLSFIPFLTIFFDWSIVDIQYGSPQVELVVKNPPENAGDVRGTGLIPRSGRSLGGGHGNPLHYSCLENPSDRAAWWATVHGIAKNLDMTQTT